MRVANCSSALLFPYHAFSSVMYLLNIWKRNSFLKAGFWTWKSVGLALLNWVTLYRGYSQHKVMNHMCIWSEMGNLQRAACELSHAFVAWVTSITQKQRLGCRTWVCPGRILVQAGSCSCQRGLEGARNCVSGKDGISDAVGSTTYVYFSSFSKSLAMAKKYIGTTPQ